MLRIAGVVGLILVGILLSQPSSFVSAAYGDEAEEAKKIEVPNEWVGKRVEVRYDASPNKSVTLIGELKSIRGQLIEMTDITQRIRTERSVPIISSIPGLSRLFKNVGIAEEKADGPYFVRTADTKSVRLAEMPQDAKDAATR